MYSHLDPNRVAQINKIIIDHEVSLALLLSKLEPRVKGRLYRSFSASGQSRRFLVRERALQASQLKCSACFTAEQAPAPRRECQSAPGIRCGALTSGTPCGNRQRCLSLRG